MFKKETCKGGVIIPKSRRSTLASQNTTQTTTRSDNEISSRLNNRINDTLNSLASLQNINDNNSLNTGGIIDTQYISDREEEIIRDNIHNNFEDDEYFYADNEEAFIEELERAKTEDLEYEYSNVLNGSNNTFGVELEFIGGDPNQIANELYQLDICGYDRQVHYHAPSISGKWKLERDVSLPTGGELVSPPLKDTPETWRNLEKVCEVAKRHGANVRSRACGAHVHTGSDPLDTAKYRWERLLKSTGSFEDVIYRMSGGERGIVRDGVRTYARRFSQNALMGLNSNFEMENSIDLRSFTRNVSRLDRYQSINLTNIYDSNKPNTVEFRSFNGSLDPKIIQNNIKIANGIMFASERARYGSSSESEAMKRRGIILKNQRIGRANHSNDVSVRDFVDTVFTRKKDKDSVLKLYAKNTWYYG